MGYEERSEETWLAALKQVIGERITQNPSILEQHSKDESFHTPRLPAAVAFAESTEEVQKILSICHEFRRPVIGFGAGSSLEGHVVPTSDKTVLTLDLTGMNKILEVHQEDLDVVVQAGVTRKQLNNHLRDTGLFFPVDPGADATIGGMAATRASGTNAVRYGTMRENILNLTAVLADGRVIKTGQRARKSSAGYDLTRLLVGSEGTLGIITEATLRLHGIPESLMAAVARFDTLEGAVNTVIDTLHCGLAVGRIELLDELQIRAVNQYSQTNYAETPTLFLEFQGSPSHVEADAAMFGELAEAHGLMDITYGKKEEERRDLWQARHNVWYANRTLRPGTKGWATDVCVPISHLAECILKTREDVDASGLIAPIVGHVGDGNFHLSIMLDPDDKEEVAKAYALNDRLVTRALEMEGTCTGEHGVGEGKIAALRQELGDAVDVMVAIKKALDPHNILNPGKIF
ncbi:MAG: FAD-binding oxidoreductase [Alphaproteobacteria bacterium]